MKLPLTISVYSLLPIMAQAPHCCQQIFLDRRFASPRMLGMLVLCFSCLGCWQEVRYEPDKPEAKPVAKSAAQVAVVETADPGADPVQELLPPAHSEGLLENSEPEVIEVIDPKTVAPALPIPEVEGEGNFGEGARYPQAEASSPGAGVVEEEVEIANLRLAAWEMGSRWSMAAALQAKGRDEESFGERLSQARHDARLLGVDLPELPSYEVGEDRLSGNVTFLLEQAGPHLANELREMHGTEHAALVELATKTHVLLLRYTPSSPRLEPVIAAIRKAAESSGLPENTWRGLLDLLTDRADFKQVKTAVFRLHREAVASLSDADG